MAAPSTWLRRRATSAASSTLLLTAAFAMNLLFLGAHRHAMFGAGNSNSLQPVGPSWTQKERATNAA
jgi:hypothetical protein